MTNQVFDSLPPSYASFVMQHPESREKYDKSRLFQLTMDTSSFKETESYGYYKNHKFHQVSPEGNRRDFVVYDVDDKEKKLYIVTPYAFMPISAKKIALRSAVVFGAPTALCLGLSAVIAIAAGSPMVAGILGGLTVLAAVYTVATPLLIRQWDKEQRSLPLPLNSSYLVPAMTDGSKDDNGQFLLKTRRKKWNYFINGANY